MALLNPHREISWNRRRFGSNRDAGRTPRALPREQAAGKRHEPADCDLLSGCQARFGGIDPGDATSQGGLQVSTLDGKLAIGNVLQREKTALVVMLPKGLEIEADNAAFAEAGRDGTSSLQSRPDKLSFRFST